MGSRPAHVEQSSIIALCCGRWHAGNKATLSNPLERTHKRAYLLLSHTFIWKASQQIPLQRKAHCGPFLSLRRRLTGQTERWSGRKSLFSPSVHRLLPLTCRATHVVASKSNKWKSWLMVWRLFSVHGTERKQDPKHWIPTVLDSNVIMFTFLACVINPLVRLVNVRSAQPLPFWERGGQIILSPDSLQHPAFTSCLTNRNILQKRRCPRYWLLVIRTHIHGH